MIEVKNLVKRYGAQQALNNVSFVVKKGEILGFLGPNGAGKSTTMNIITGYLSSTSGTVLIDGINILENPKACKRKIGFLPELPPLYVDMTVMEYLKFIYNLKKAKLPMEAHLREICKLVKIDDVSHRLIKNLSKGYRQRVGIAQAMVGNPEILILDEPTVGLDPQQIIDIRNLIRKLGKTHTVILSSHILSEIQATCERVVVINKGQIIADDTPDNLSKTLNFDSSITARIIGNKAEIESALKSIENIMSVECVGMREGDSYEFKIETKPNVDVRRQMWQILQDKNMPLILLKFNELSLEEIFLKLTSVTGKQRPRDEKAKAKKTVEARNKAAKAVNEMLEQIGKKGEE